MTLRERQRFMRELTRNVLSEALAKAKNMPEEWDGHELRRYLADKFEDASITLRTPSAPFYRARIRAYRHTVYERNL